MTQHFFGPGFKSLDSAMRSYLQLQGGRALWALAINPRTGKWHTVLLGVRDAA